MEPATRDSSAKFNRRLLMQATGMRSRAAQRPLTVVCEVNARRQQIVDGRRDRLVVVEVPKI